MSSFGQRVKERRKEIGMSQVDLAKKSGLSQATISAIERDKNRGSREIVAISKTLRCRPEWLDTGTGDKERPDTVKINWPDRNTSQGPEPSGMVPLISWVHAGLFCSSPDLFHPGDADEMFPTFKKMGPHSYALRVVGDSMVSPLPGAKSYPPGCILYVDPDKPVTNGCRVIARIHEDEVATFKIYSEDAGKRYLRPLNPQYPTIEMTSEMHICGVVTGVYSDD